MNAHGSAKPVFVIGILFVILLALFSIGFFPRTARSRQLSAAADSSQKELPAVTVVRAEQAPTNSELLLPGNIQAVTEAPLYARTDGYVKKRLADIGDRVKRGQLLAEIESPEVDQQLAQARANVLQAESALGQSQAALQQAKANANLSELTFKRSVSLVERGVLAKQDGDEKLAANLARQADVAAAEANVRAAQNAISAASANVNRLLDVQGFQKVLAPYDGMITVRNVVLGTLVSAGSMNSVRELYRITQLDPLKITINVPQSEVQFVRVGQEVEFEVQEFPGRRFRGRVARTANSLDAASRALTTEIQFSNPKQELLPGMYAQAHFVSVRQTPPLLIPGDAITTGEGGTRVAVVADSGVNHVVKFHQVQVGRDYGAHTEIKSGLHAGDLVILNPTDDVKDGVMVHPMLEKK